MLLWYMLPTPQHLCSREVERLLFKFAYDIIAFFMRSIRHHETAFTFRQRQRQRSCM